MATMDKWDEKFTQEDLARLAVDMVHRTIVHHVFWFKEVEHQMGTEEAMKIFDAAYKRSYDTQMKRLGKFFGFEMWRVPACWICPEKGSDCSGLQHWLANDGIWFQVEFAHA